MLTVEEKYLPNKPLEALNCYGTSSLEHPGVQVSRRWQAQHSHCQCHGTIRFWTCPVAKQSLR